MRQLDRILDDVDLFLERRCDVYRRIRDDQRLRIGRHVHHEAVAYASCSTQSGVALDDRAHQLIRVKASLHQRLGPAFAYDRDRLLGGGMTERSILDRQPADSIPHCLATASMRERGPTRIGEMRPRRAASRAPSSELWSQGWTTAVGVGGSDLQESSRR